MDWTIVFGIAVASAIPFLLLVGDEWFKRRSAAKLKTAVDRFAEGDFTPVQTDAAFGSTGLVHALNQMAHKLEQRFARQDEQRTERDAILESMSEGVFAIGNDERIISVNRAAAQLLHIDETTVQGRPLVEVVRNADLEAFARLALQSHEPVQREIELHHNGGHSIEVKGAVLQNTRGDSIGAVLVLNDVTRLRKLERVRRDFVSNVTHE